MKLKLQQTEVNSAKLKFSKRGIKSFEYTITNCLILKAEVAIERSEFSVV